MWRLAEYCKHLQNSKWMPQRTRHSIGNRSSLWDSQTAVYEGHVTSKLQLHTVLQPIFDQNFKNVVLFLQDELSVDDFTHYSRAYRNENSFHHVQSFLKSSASSLVLPAVDWRATSELLEYLETKEDWNIVVLGNDKALQLEVDKSRSNLLVVKFPPMNSMSDKSTTKALTENDAILGKITTMLKAQNLQFTVIYTAERPSRVPRSAFKTFHTGRQLMATEPEISVPYPPLNITNGTDTCIIFYATKLSFTFKKALQFDLTNLTFVSHEVNFSSSVCSDTNTMLSMFYSNPATGIDSLEIRFLMSNKFYTGSARNWFTLDFVEIVHKSEVARFNVSISAPAEYSFHCQLVGTSSIYGAQLIPSNTEAENWEILISEFQIQGFNVKDNLFSYASDCTSFFCPAIWMALVTSLVLLYILTYGIHMIMQLTTNDRFDDPKGLALTVPQTE
ncbi:V-type proton ATPase subunit S1-like [Latimeria chalumnae]|uniref:V-type proton ATPase subunit S1-like n=1 Tax=Latimeria chalumnae TaxID=7897 RepID=UPI00313B9DDF